MKHSAVEVRFQSKLSITSKHTVLKQPQIFSTQVQGDFLIGPPLKMSLDWPPPNLLGLAPPKFSKCWSHIHFARHLDVFRSLGGPVWDSDDFLKSVTYRPTLSKFRGGPVKKITLYDICFSLLVQYDIDTIFWPQK